MNKPIESYLLAQQIVRLHAKSVEKEKTLILFALVDCSEKPEVPTGQAGGIENRRLQAGGTHANLEPSPSLPQATIPLAR